MIIWKDLVTYLGCSYSLVMKWQGKFDHTAKWWSDRIKKEVKPLIWYPVVYLPKYIFLNQSNLWCSKHRQSLSCAILRKHFFQYRWTQSRVNSCFFCLSQYAWIIQHMKRERFLFYFTSAINLTLACSAIHLHHRIMFCVPEFLFL